VTRAEKVARAQQLRSEGLKLREIGEEMGYSISAVNAWLCDPDRSAEVARKDSYRGTCEECGARTDGSNGAPNAPSQCADCHRTRNAERNKRLVEMWNAGEPTSHIAKKLEMDERAVLSWVNFRRERHGTDLQLRRLGGDADDRDARHRQIIEWRSEGLTNADIAERLGTTKESVSTMFAYCRRLGLDVPPAPFLRRGNPRKATAEQLEQLWAEGLTTAQIADFCGYACPGSVCSVVAELRRRGRNFPARRPGRRAVAA